MDLKKYKDFETSIERLEEAYIKTTENKNGEYYSFFRDSAIQRFEFTKRSLINFILILTNFPLISQNREILFFQNQYH